MVFFSCLFLLLAGSSFCASRSIVQAASATEASDLPYLYDDAKILTSTQQEDLEAFCKNVSIKNSIDVFILTEPKLKVTRKEYIEDFYDKLYDEKGITDATLVLINMDPSNRGIELQGYGQCEFNLSEDRIEVILDAMMPDLADGNYFDALSVYVDKVDYYMNTSPTTYYQHTEEDNRAYDSDLTNEDNYYVTQTKQNFLVVTGRNLLIAFVIGGVVVGIMAYNSGGKNTTSPGTYLSPQSRGVIGRWDRYLHTTTTKHRKPQDTNNHTGGGGSFHAGGGVSSGGHSHSGGGRSF